MTSINKELNYKLKYGKLPTKYEALLMDGILSSLY